ncbi:nucleotidyltransferase domain-containing protein [Geoalkalibacter halelectricus]|uniref:nucleotidyltransferase domain-containing protein n=1 Tax=Geoalkalibacter halelectricus TaxID=2847045 RepID=UPI003D24BDC2
MGEKDRQIVLELKRRLPAEVREHLARLILYGSRARGEAAEESDLDLVALVDDKTPELEAQMEEIAYSVMWDHDFKPIISLKVFSEQSFRQAAAKGFSFYRNVEREGIEL